MIATEADSWLMMAIEDLATDWEAQGHKVKIEYDANDLPAGDLCFCLGLGQLMPDTARERFEHVLVVHESDLPKGRGWSPLTWQILEGEHRIPVTLFEAEATVDSGPVYAQRWLQFEGHELIDELRAAQASATRGLCRWFVDKYPQSVAHTRAQTGPATYYARRRPKDSELDAGKTLAEQFDQLRVADNDRYPACFRCRGEAYALRIDRMTQ